MDIGATNPLLGLSADEVIKSRAENGANALSRRKRKSFLRNLLGNFADPMIKVLLVALGINVILLFNQGEWLETAGIAVAVFVAVLVATLSERGSESAFERLRESALNIDCRVRRGGQTQVLRVNKLVVGDIVLLGAGDKIPADGEMVQGSLEVDQSALNGESKEARKFAHQPKSGEGFLNSTLLFSGTVVTAGEGVMRVLAVGDKTFYGKIADELQEDTPESPLKIKLKELAKKISVYGYLGAVLVSVAYLFNVFVISNNFVWADIIKSLSNPQTALSHLIHAGALAVTVIVMAVPEGLPMMITVVLSQNMRRMLKDSVLIRKLNGIETAGSMNILFTDKTGTLTNGKLTVVNVINGNAEVFSAQKFLNKSAYADLISLSLKLNTGAELLNLRAIGGNATDRVLLEFADKIPFSRHNLKKEKTIPFSSQNKFMATTVQGSERFTLIKGAPEKILPYCTESYNENGESVKVFKKDAVQDRINELQAKAMRIIAVAISETDANENGIFKNLKLVALIGIRDQIREEAQKSVAEVKGAGIQVVMITGDSKATAVAIATETGILSEKSDIVLTSGELANLSDGALKEILPNLKVVARALPSDKSRLVRIAQSLNLVAGMTGDGVNDAPALKKADIGFAMGSGTEVAKEAGDVVILDDNFNSICRAVSYGRTVFKSIRKFIIFQLTINFCAVAISILAPLINIKMPITIIQMLWINLVIDTLAGLAFGGEPPKPQYMKEPPKKRNEPIINRYMWGQIITASAYTAVLSVWFLTSPAINRLMGSHGEGYLMTAFFALFMFVAIFNSLNARTHGINLFSKIRQNKQFILVMVTIFITQLFILYFGGKIFRTVKLDLKHLAVIIAIAFSVIPVDMIRKAVLRKFNLVRGT
ncbi:MAG: calcium-translocating P-type ATPase, PMCA-type [Firmicutes bacterium]|nr:calcium-translocating P-type ATPase, PMCA-type [Bacillota bacterium]